MMVAEKVSNKKSIKYFILAIVLLFGGFFLPFFGEFVRVETIGEEHRCCMMPDTEEELRALERGLDRARESRGLANSYMIGGMSAGIISTVAAGIIFYLNLRKVKIKCWLKIVSGIIFGLLLMGAVLWAVGGLVEFLSDIDGYYSFAGWGYIYL